MASSSTQHSGWLIHVDYGQDVVDHDVIVADRLYRLINFTFPALL